MKKELLSPAGNIESLYQAVHNGADAIYISGKNYGARKFADNFTIEEMEHATKYCHLYGVKVYVTVNTLIYESEIEEFINYIKELVRINVDALIMQDIGMISLVKQKFPNLEIHASTQCHNHNEQTVKFFEKLGVSRVVLARELSLDEIKNIKTPLEKEIFIHGALCISYSGLCLFSSILLNRSGNRGECAGFCRLPYELYEKDKKIETKGKYLLSPKDLCSVEYLKEILDSDIKSLKIEGRMKSPEYVGFVTKVYRTLIDKYYNNEEMTITEEEFNNLKKLYSRKFTKGFLNNTSYKDLINIESPNHQGVYLGEVIKTTKNKITIKLKEELNQGDGIRFSNNEGMIANYIYNQKGLLINSGKPNEIIELDNKVNLYNTGKVIKTQDIKLINKLKNYNEKKLKVNFLVEAKLNQNLKITIKYNDISITEEENVIEKSINKTTTKEEMKEKLSKLGNTPFVLGDIEFSIDENIFIPIKEINNIRRVLVEKLKSKLEQQENEIIEKEFDYKPKNIELTKEVSFLVRTEEQINALINKNVNIYIENYELYKKYQKENVYYRTPRVEKVSDYSDDNLVITTFRNDIGNNCVSDIYLNNTNSYTTEILSKLGIKKIGLSIELSTIEVKNLIESFKEKYKTIPNVEELIYGYPELMIMKYCPLNSLLKKDNAPCSICKNKNFYLKDRNNEKYKIYNVNCLNYIMGYKPINNIDKIIEYQKMGINNFRIDLLDETKEEVLAIFSKISQNIFQK